MTLIRHRFLLIGHPLFQCISPWALEPISRSRAYATELIWPQFETAMKCGQMGPSPRVGVKTGASVCDVHHLSSLSMLNACEISPPVSTSTVRGGS